MLILSLQGENIHKARLSVAVWRIVGAAAAPPVSLIYYPHRRTPTQRTRNHDEGTPTMCVFLKFNIYAITNLTYFLVSVYLSRVPLGHKFAYKFYV